MIGYTAPILRMSSKNNKKTTPKKRTPLILEIVESVEIVETQETLYI